MKHRKSLSKSIKNLQQTPIWVFALGIFGWLLVPMISAILFLIKGGSRFDFGVFFEPYSVSLGAILAIVGALYEIANRDKQQYSNFQIALKDLDERLYDIQRTLERNDDFQSQVGNLVDSYIILRSGPRGETMGRFADAVILRAKEELEQLQKDLKYTFEVQSKTEQFSQRWLDSLNEMISGRGEFITISNMLVWSPRNLGFRDGYSEYHNKQLEDSIQLDYKIRRIFVMPNYSLLVRNLDRAQAYLETLEMYLSEVTTISNRANSIEERHEARVYICPNEERYRAHFNDEGRDPSFSENVALWMTDDSSVANTVSYLPNPASLDSLENYDIRRIGFTWEPAIISRKVKRFKELWKSNSTEPLDSYCLELKSKLAERFPLSE